MKYAMRLRKSLIWGCVAGLTLPVTAHAYLDPGTGSYVLQLVTAAFFGVLYVVKSHWNMIKLNLKKFFSK